MQLLTFPQPRETPTADHVIKMLEETLERAKRGEITAAVIVTLDDRGEDDDLDMLAAVDSRMQAAGMLAIAQTAITQNAI